MSRNFFKISLKKQKAFTLIELLIVVAIIAILAAIAVPNFLEAQTRAKVSRTKNDIRSLCVGLESYMVDSNKYPVPRIAYVPDPIGEGIQSCSSVPYIIELTTPIAYLATVANMIDLFAPKNSWFDSRAKWGAFSKHEMSLQYTNMDPNGGIWGMGRMSEDKNSQIWVTACVSAWGPSRVAAGWPEWSVFEDGPYKTPYIMIPFGTQKNPDMRKAAWDVVYDATNGTMSRGGIFRFIGALGTPGH
jgi:prepilin-type N-terminal cleavage/methylation domain-containing protein